MKQNNLLIIMIIATIMALSSCTKDLNLAPLDPTLVTPDVLYNDTSNYIHGIAKCYAGLVVTGQQGQSGQPDIANGDEGVTSFLRVLFTAEENGTEECMNVWNDGGLNEYHFLAVSDLNNYNRVLYTRIFYNIAVCNEFIRQVNPRVGGLSGRIKEEVTLYLAEARFLRALYYYYAMDFWANPPFVTENDAVGGGNPPQIKRADLFTYIESELKAVTPMLLPANKDVQYYGRANKAAAWTLFAKLYLNAKVFTGTANFPACKIYCDSILNSGVYSLVPTYANLFLADNNVTSRSEIIFPIVEDGTNSQQYGGMTFICNAAHWGKGGDAAYYGVTGGWGGNLTTTTMIHKFADPSGATDTRALFRDHGTGVIAPVATINQNSWNTALQIAKFRNVTSTGVLGANRTFADTDFPLFRLADVYLMRAEATVSTNNAAAITDINTLRQRAYGNASGNVSSVDINLIFDERCRELYWEATRRSDLVRQGLFTSSDYLWDWKGGVIGGRGVSEANNIFQIPATDITVNSNLVQNPVN